MITDEGFAELWAARTDRWSLVKQFINDWQIPLMPGDGYSESEIQSAEMKLGFRLPTALREWYALVGKRKEVNQQNNFLCPPDSLSEWNGMLAFYHENQSIQVWGIRPEDIATEDPPVWVRIDDGLWTELPQDGLLSEFVFAMFVQETCFRCKYYNLLGWDASGGASDFPTLGIAPIRFDTEAEYKFWAGKETVMMTDTSGNIVIACGTDAAREIAITKLDAENAYSE